MNGSLLSRLYNNLVVRSRSLRYAALALAGLIATMPAAVAEAVPMPKPAPRAKIAQPQNDTAPRAPQNFNDLINRPNSAPPSPIVPPPGGRSGGQIAALDADQRAIAGKVSAYLSSLQTLSGNFVQVGPDGSRTTGDFYIQKPGKVKFEYSPPSKIDIVADGSSMVVRDRKLATQDLYPLSQTPLRYLLADKIDIARDTNLIGIKSDELFVSVTIEEKQPLIGTSRLMIMFSTKDMQLKQWTVTDPQGYDTTVAVYNLDTTKKIDPRMFVIDYTNYNQGTGNSR